ncbi:MAG: GAF domain-containing protein [Deltaproteobacteria bacterium]|nr:GAF domain-containing protein [Deltaproteobacteria bacterium]
MNVKGPELLERDRVALLEAEVASLQDRLRATELKLEGIKQIGQILASEQGLDTVLEEIIQRTTALMGCERATIFLLSSDETELWSRVASTGSPGPAGIQLQVGRGIAGWVVEQGRSVNVKDAYKDPRFDPTIDHLTGFRTRSILCQPMRDSRQQILGVIQALNKIDGYFTTADEGLLLAIGSQAAVCIQNSRLYLDLVGRNIDLFDTQLRLKERTAEIELLFKLERTAAVAMTLSEALDGALAHTLSEYAADVAAVLLTDPRRGDLALERTHGRLAASLGRPHVERAQPLLAEVIAARAPRTVSREPLEPAPLPPLDGRAVDHVVALPIARADEDPLGVLVLVNPERHPPGFAQHDLHKLEVIASRMALSIVLARAMEEERKAERMAAVGGALSGVMHDLRTPLTVIGGHVRALEREDDGDKRKAHREVVKRQIELMQQMIKELLAFARGQSEVLLRKIWVRELMTEVEELLTAELEGSGVALVVDHTFRGAIKADDLKLKRAIANLARNAREAMGDGGGTFTVRVTEDEGWATFTFSDTGPGIPPEIERRLFDSFATHGKKGGTGLGLAIVKKIVEDHGGRLSVTSAPGEGTTFSIALPVVG